MNGRLKPSRGHICGKGCGHRATLGDHKVCPPKRKPSANRAAVKGPERALRDQQMETARIAAEATSSAEFDSLLLSASDIQRMYSQHAK